METKPACHSVLRSSPLFQALPLHALRRALCPRSRDESQRPRGDRVCSRREAASSEPTARTNIEEDNADIKMNQLNGQQ